MEKFCIDSCGAKCNIDTDRNIKEFFENNKHKLTMPNIKVYDKFDENVNYLLEYRNSSYDKIKIICDDNSIKVRYPAEMLTDSNIAYIARYLLEKQYAINSLCTCHSSCVEKDGKAILFLGGAGSGKTSIALNMCIKHGFKLISNDQTLIGIVDNKLSALGGTKNLSLRYTSVKENIPSLAYLFNDANVEGWGDKIVIQGSEVGIDEQYETTNIEEIYVLHIDNKQKQLFYKSGDCWGLNFNLYQNLSENIRNSISTIVDMYGHPIGYVPSYDNEELYNLRVNIINMINNNDDYRYISGNLDDVINYILNNREKKKSKVLKSTSI